MAKDTGNRTKIARWGRKFWTTDNKAASFKLTHRAASGKGSDVASFPAAEMDEDLWSSTVDDIAQSIHDDAEGIGGNQNYVLLALNSEGEVLGRLALRQYGMTEDEESDNSFASEPATGKGLLAMFMRHLEGMHRNQTVAYGKIMAGQQTMLQTQAELVERMSAKHLELVMRTEELMSQKHQRELDAMETQAGIENKQEVMKRLVSLLPPLVKKFTGATPDNMLPPEIHELRDWLGGITEEQLEQLKMILPPDKVIALLSLMEQNAEREEKEAPPNGKVIPPH